MRFWNDWTEWEGTYDGRKGQPPIHPSVLCKVLLFAMTRQIRSSRAIEVLSPLAEVACDENPAIRDDLTQPVNADDIEKLPQNASTKVFDRQAFVYEEQAEGYYCPDGRPDASQGDGEQDAGERHCADGQDLAEVVECCGT